MKIIRQTEKKNLLKKKPAGAMRWSCIFFFFFFRWKKNMNTWVMADEISLFYHCSAIIIIIMVVFVEVYSHWYTECVCVWVIVKKNSALDRYLWSRNFQIWSCFWVFESNGHACLVYEYVFVCVCVCEREWVMGKKFFSFVARKNVLFFSLLQTQPLSDLFDT